MVILDARRAFIIATLYGCSALLPKAIGFVLLIWMARSLPVDDYAIFGLIYAIQSGLGVIAQAGIFEVIVAKTINEPKEQDQLYAQANSTFLIALVIWLIIGGVYLVSTGTIGQITPLIAGAIAGGILGFTTLQSQLLRLEERHYSAIWLQFFVSISSYLGGVVLFTINHSVASFFIGSAIGSAISLVVLSTTNVGNFTSSSNLKAVSVISRGTLPFIAIGILGWLNGYGNNYIISSTLTLRDVATFTILLSISSGIQILGSAINQVWSPRFFQIYRSGRTTELERLSKKIFSISAVCMGLASAILLQLYIPAIDQFGENLIAYRNNRLELSLMCAAYLVVIPLWHCQNYFTASGRSKEFLQAVVLGTSIGYGIWIFMIISLGSLGIFFGYLLQALIRSAIITYSANRFWKLEIPYLHISIGIAVLLLGLI